MEIKELFDLLHSKIVKQIPTNVEKFRLMVGIDGIATRSQVQVLNDSDEWKGGEFGGLEYEDVLAIKKIRGEQFDEKWVRMELVFTRTGVSEVKYFNDNPGVFED